MANDKDQDTRPLENWRFKSSDKANEPRDKANEPSENKQAPSNVTPFSRSQSREKAVQVPKILPMGVSNTDRSGNTAREGQTDQFAGNGTGWSAGQQGDRSPGHAADRKEAYAKRRRIPLWLKIIGVPVLGAAALYAGLYVGYGIIGKEPTSTLSEGLKHMYMLVFGQ